MIVVFYNYYVCGDAIHFNVAWHSNDAGVHIHNNYT